MPWQTPTTADVLEAFTPQENTSLNTIQGGTKQLDGILTKAVASARGSIAAGGNEVDAAGTLPDQVIPDVLAIVRWRWLASFPQLKLMQTDARQKAYDDGIKALRDIANGKPKVERPVNAAPSTGSLVTMPSVGPRHRHFSRRHEDGI